MKLVFFLLSITTTAIISQQALSAQAGQTNYMACTLSESEATVSLHVIPFSPLPAVTHDEQIVIRSCD